MLSANLLPAVANSIGDGDILHHSPVSGGNINQVYCLQTKANRYLLKLNSKSWFPGMFNCEAAGLKAIAGTHTIAVPAVIAQSYVADDSFLILEWIESKRPLAKASQLLGEQLAAMHQCTSPRFGFEADNYMGSLRQSNIKHNTWAAFFVRERLVPMVNLAADNRYLNIADQQNFETLYRKLPQLFDEEVPALTHGDLWGGNYLTDTNNKPYLIDPAVSYGHREFDIAMTTLFGGFDKCFYDAYNQAMPLNKNWRDRVDLWNLYPLLLHLNLFGKGYLAQVRDCLKGYL